MLKNLKALRESRRLNQQELAELLHISQASVSKYEIGLAEPDIYIIKRIANFFQVSIEYLNGDEKKQPMDNDSLTEKEKQFLADYGKLSPLQKDEVRALMRAHLSSQS